MATDVEKIRRSLLRSKKLAYEMHRLAPDGSSELLTRPEAHAVLRGQDLATSAYVVEDVETGVMILRQDHHGEVEVGCVPRRYRNLAGFAMRKSGIDPKYFFLRFVQRTLRRVLP